MNRNQREAAKLLSSALAILNATDDEEQEESYEENVKAFKDYYTRIYNNLDNAIKKINKDLTLKNLQELQSNIKTCESDISEESIRLLEKFLEGAAKEDIDAGILQGPYSEKKHKKLFMNLFSALAEKVKEGREAFISANKKLKKPRRKSEKPEPGSIEEAIRNIRNFKV